MIVFESLPVMRSWVQWMGGKYTMPFINVISVIQSSHHAQSQAKCLPNMKSPGYKVYVVCNSCHFPSKLKILSKIRSSHKSDEEKERYCLDNNIWCMVII